MRKVVFFCMKAVIMAGGEGVRLRPMTSERPKPLVPILGTSVIEHIVVLLKKHGITDIAVTLHYMPGEIKSELGDGSEYGVKLTYFIEEEPLGTCGSVKNCKGFLDDTFIVISGDAITDMDLTEIANFHHKVNSKATIVTKKVPVPLEYGVVLADESGRITGFVEKPDWGEVKNDRVNTGVYILSPDVMEMCPENTFFDFSKDLFPKILESNIPFYAFETSGYWCDIGEKHAYMKANLDALNKDVKLIPEAVEISNGVWVDKNAIVADNVILNPPVYIGKGCCVNSGAHLSGSVIGNGTVIDKGARVLNSVLWNNTNVSKGVTVEKSIVCDKVQLGSSSFLYECVVGKEVVVGKCSVIKSGVRIWPNIHVEDEKTVTRTITKGRSSVFEFGQSGFTGFKTDSINPEYLARLGASFGTLLGPSTTVGTSSDGTGHAQMMLLALESGLASTGLQVKRGNDITLPVLRWTCRQGILDGAVYIGSDPTGDEGMVIVFLNSYGNDLSKKERRKLKSIFEKEEYTFVDIHNVLPIKELTNPEDFYVTDIYKYFNEAYKALRMVPLNYTKEEQEAITAYIIASYHKEAPIFVSVGSYLSASRVAEYFGSEIVMCGDSRGDIMEKMEEYMDVDGVYQQYLMLFDDFAFNLALCHYSASKDFSVKNMVASLPRIYKKEREIYCDNDRKAELISYFTNSPQYEGKFEINDGLLMYNDNVHVRLFADENRPSFKIQVEGFNEEYAQSLIDELFEAVDRYLNR